MTSAPLFPEAEVCSVAPLRNRLQDRLLTVGAQIAAFNAKYEAMPYKYVDPERDAIDEQRVAAETEEAALVAAITQCQSNEIKGISASIPEIPEWRAALAKERLEQAKEAQEQAIADAKEAADSPFGPEPVKPPEPGVDCPFTIPPCKRGESIFWVQAHANRPHDPYPWEPVAGALVKFEEWPDRQFITFRQYFYGGRQDRAHRADSRSSWSLADLKTARVVAEYGKTRAKVIDKARKLFTDHGAPEWRTIFKEAEAKLKDLPPKPSKP